MTIDKEEFFRSWMKLRAVAALECPAEKDITRWTDGGLITLKDQNPKADQVRLYSLANAIEIKFIFEMSASGNLLPLAGEIAGEAIVRTVALLNGTAHTPFGPLVTESDWNELKLDKDKPWLLYSTTEDGEVYGDFVLADNVQEFMLGNTKYDPDVDRREKRLLPMDHLICETMVRYFEALDNGTLEACNKTRKG